VDFSWVKQLAEQSNQQELQRQEKERNAREDKRLAALATVPFVEKIFVLIQTCTDEFNKHCMFPNLRIVNSRLTKWSKTPDVPGAEPDEVAYFMFARTQYMYGIRGVNGLVEFVELPVTDTSSSLNMRLHELGIDASKTFEAELDPATRAIVWKMNGRPLDGPAIISTCQQYFSEFISRTNEDT